MRYISQNMINKGAIITFKNKYRYITSKNIAYYYLKRSIFSVDIKKQNITMKYIVEIKFSIILVLYFRNISLFSMIKYKNLNNERKIKYCQNYKKAKNSYQFLVYSFLQILE